MVVLRLGKIFLALACIAYVCADIYPVSEKELTDEAAQANEDPRNEAIGEIDPPNEGNDDVFDDDEEDENIQGNAHFLERKPNHPDHPDHSNRKRPAHDKNFIHKRHGNGRRRYKVKKKKGEEGRLLRDEDQRSKRQLRYEDFWVNQQAEVCEEDPCCRKSRDQCERPCACEGEKGNHGPPGQRGHPGPPGARGPPGPDGEDGRPGGYGPAGAKGSKGDRGRPGDVGNPGPPGTAGPSGPPGADGIRGPTGRDGEKGDKGSIGSSGTGEKGARGPKGDDGRWGIPGSPGDKGNKGEKGNRGLPGCPGEGGGCNGRYIYTKHSQTAEVPRCHRGFRRLWVGFSFLHSEDDGRANVQDLGDPGSCREEFDPMPFMFCNTEGTCMHSRRTSSSFWLATMNATQYGYDSKKPMNKIETIERVSRCVVCEALGPVVAIHEDTRSNTHPKCEDMGYTELWRGDSYLMHSVGAMAGGQQLGSSGSCLRYTRNMFIECNGRGIRFGNNRDQAGECQIFSDKFNYWMYNFRNFRQGGNTFVEAEIKDYISECAVCVNLSGC